MLTQATAVELFARRRAAWLRADLDGYLALWAENMTFRSPVHAQPLRGKSAFAELVRHSLSLMKPVSFEVRHLAVQAEHLLAEWKIVVSHRQTGELIEWEGMSVAQIEDGLITFWREYWNPADLILTR